jgi:hypothetical protein
MSLAEISTLRRFDASRSLVVLGVSSLHPEVSPFWTLSGHDAHQLHPVVAGSITAAG